VKGEIMAKIIITVNGRQRTIDLDPQTPLLWVLRDVLHLTGTKFGCGLGICGSCTVLIDNQPHRSCTTAVSTLAGKQIITIEGLSTDGNHPVQQAWKAEGVPQCGYCQSGQMLTAVALLSATPQPTEAQIDEVMSSVLCRCGTYVRIRQAIQRAARGGNK
jgi:aerobic-type carbon monoxide dehydrogenase small subunit (CoxS/CutS family)